MDICSRVTVAIPANALRRAPRSTVLRVDIPRGTILNPSHSVIAGVYPRIIKTAHLEYVFTLLLWDSTHVSEYKIRDRSICHRVCEETPPEVSVGSARHDARNCDGW
jgi:hypothetical protein